MFNITIAFGKNNTNCVERKNFPENMAFRCNSTRAQKDDPAKRENFVPIILQPVLSKVFTLLIRNRLYTFAADNGYIETNIQKDFWEKISG